MSPTTTGLATLTGMYGGYFGAGSGVMMLAVLGLGTDLPFRVANALKTLAVLAANLMASMVFLVAADLHWRAVAPLTVGSSVAGTSAPTSAAGSRPRCSAPGSSPPA